MFCKGTEKTTTDERYLLIEIKNEVFVWGQDLD